jgi:hypothetical protein
VPVLAAGGLIAGLAAVTAVANTGAATWHDADALGAAAVLPPIAGALLFAGVAWLCERGRAHAAGAPAPAAATVGLARSEHAVWVGHASSRVLAAAGLVVALGLAVAAMRAGGGAAPAGLAGAAALALTTAAFSTVRVTVSSAGVRIAFGPLGAPAKRIPLDQVAQAEATLIEPLAWGGWGYRWAGRGRTAVVLRRGPGLVLELRDGRRFAVTVDSPEQAAGLLNDLVMRDHAQRS